MLLRKFFPRLKLNFAEISAWPKRIATSIEQFELMESDYVALAAFSHLRNWKHLSDDDILRVHTPNLDRSYPEDLVKQLRMTLKLTFPVFEITWIHKIRAKLAALELLAAFDSSLGIPILVRQAVYYTGTKRVIEYLHVNQALTKSRSAEARKHGTQQIDNYVDAIKTDGRKFKPKKYTRWFVYQQFEQTAAIIRGARLGAKQNRVNKKVFLWFSESWNLSDELKNCILNDSGSVKELALEILQHRGLIDEPKAFREFQAQLNKETKESFSSTTAFQFLDMFLFELDLAPDEIFGSNLFEPLNTLEFDFDHW